MDTVSPSHRRQVTTNGEAPGADPLVDLEAFAEVPFPRRRLKRGEAVFQMGDPFRAIYGVRSGFFKTTNTDESSREQVVGFFMRGELFGLDGLGSQSYNCTARALEDSELVVFPFALMQERAREKPALQHQLHQMLSREISRDHGMMMLLGSMGAEARLASFLLNLSARFVQRGYSPSDFVLRMTREDIGSYLGLKLETVSRAFSQFHRRGLLKVEQKHIHIRDILGLQRILAEPLGKT